MSLLLRRETREYFHEQSNQNYMKALFKWRTLLRLVLFSVGFLAFARAHGEPVKPMSDAEWLWQFVLSLGIGAICFIAFCKLSEKKLKTNTKYNPYGNQD